MTNSVGHLAMCTFQVTPKPREVEHLAADMTRVAQGMANTISVQLAGGWLPVECVSGVSACVECISFSTLNPTPGLWCECLYTWNAMAAQQQPSMKYHGG